MKKIKLQIVLSVHGDKVEVSSCEITPDSGNVGVLPVEFKKRTMRGSSHTGAKITEAEVRTIRNLAADGACQAALGRRYRISTSAVQLIVAKKRWAHVS